MKCKGASIEAASNHFREKEDPQVLVLGRKQGEEILIGDDIRLVVQRISGNRVTIGITAPEDKTIIRAELLDCIDDAIATRGPDTRSRPRWPRLSRLAADANPQQTERLP